jgi:hypothetical protein
MDREVFPYDPYYMKLKFFVSFLSCLLTEICCRTAALSATGRSRLPDGGSQSAEDDVVGASKPPAHCSLATGRIIYDIEIL